MELDSKFNHADRQRIQALKAQLKWQCINIHQGNRFRLVVNPYKHTHTIYFPKENQYNPSLYNYLLELTRAFYCEKYGAIFGDCYFDPDTDKSMIPIYNSIISASQHWFTSIFCCTNFSEVWQASLNIKYKSMLDNHEIDKNNHNEILNAGLICAQLSWIKKQSTSKIIGGSLKDLVNIFVQIDPTKIDVAPLAILVNNILELFQPGKTLQLNQQRQGNFWKLLN